MLDWVREMYKDLFFSALVLGNWVLTGLVADHIAPDDKSTKQGLSIWVAIFSVGINSLSFVRSYMLIGSPKAPPETLIGLWSEVVNLTQMWGALFCLARYYSLDDAHAFFQHGLLTNLGESVWEMGFVQAGVGYVAVTPTTFGEKLVAWMAAYVGGVFASSMFFASVVLGRRAHWERPKPEEKPLMAMDTSASGSWRVTLR